MRSCGLLLKVGMAFGVAGFITGVALLAVGGVQSAALGNVDNNRKDGPAFEFLEGACSILSVEKCWRMGQAAGEGGSGGGGCALDARPTVELAGVSMSAEAEPLPAGGECGDGCEVADWAGGFEVGARVDCWRTRAEGGAQGTNKVYECPNADCVKLRDPDAELREAMKGPEVFLVAGGVLMGVCGLLGGASFASFLICYEGDEEDYGASFSASSSPRRQGEGGKGKYGDLHPDLVD